MKFRVLSDLHVDYNDRYPLEIPEDGRDVFTVICGDTSGSPEDTIDWIRKNVKRGVLISGNHLPYCNYGDPSKRRTMDELRRVLADAFPESGDITYFDAETGTVKKVVDGVMFLGSCCYTDMRIGHEYWNPDGDPVLNRMCSEYNMNDYRYGYTGREWPAGADNAPSMVRMKAEDYEKWFMRAVSEFNRILSENEASANPLPVVLVTHHPLIKDFLTRSYYVDDCSRLNSPREFNWASYASDRKAWLKSHGSVRCYCCGHIHAVEKDWRHYSVRRENGDDLLIVNNTRGYVSKGHSADFNVNTFVDTSDWSVRTDPLSDEAKAEIETVRKNSARNLAWSI